MANAVQTKLQKISGEYSTKVADMRKLEADKRKPFVTDAQTKTINEKEMIHLFSTMTIGVLSYFENLARIYNVILLPQTKKVLFLKYF